MRSEQGGYDGAAERTDPASERECDPNEEGDDASKRNDRRNSKEDRRPNVIFYDLVPARLEQRDFGATIVERVVQHLLDQLSDRAVRFGRRRRPRRL